MTTKQIATIDKLVSRQEVVANALSIDTLEDMKKATELLSEVNRMADKIEEEKELLTKPLNVALKEIRLRYKPIETTLENAISTIRTKMTIAQKKFDVEVEAKKEKLIARIEKGTMRIETAVSKMENMPNVNETIHTDSGSVQWMIVKKLVIDDVSKIPQEYFDVNEVRIKEALKKGLIIAGARMVEEKVPKNTR